MTSSFVQREREVKVGATCLDDHARSLQLVAQRLVKFSGVVGQLMFSDEANTLKDVINTTREVIAFLNH